MFKPMRFLCRWGYQKHHKKDKPKTTIAPGPGTSCSIARSVFGCQLSRVSICMMQSEALQSQTAQAQHVRAEKGFDSSANTDVLLLTPLEKVTSPLAWLDEYRLTYSPSPPSSLTLYRREEEGQHKRWKSIRRYACVVLNLKWTALKRLLLVLWNKLWQTWHQCTILDDRSTVWIRHTQTHNVTQSIVMKINF